MTAAYAHAARVSPATFLRAASGYGRRVFTTRLRRSLAYRLLIGGPSPTRILARPQLVIPGEPGLAAALYRGQFDLARCRFDVGARNPFAVAPPSPDWLEELVGFDWLRHLAADGGVIAAAQARACVADWIEVQGRWHEVAWRPDLVARRMTSWLGHADVIVHGADQAFFDSFITALGRQLRYLLSAVDTTARPRTRLAVRIAIVQAGLCLDDCERIVPRACDQLERELEAQILPDGGHADRNPQTLVELLPTLICLRDTFAQRDLEPPHELICAIERMLPMLRLFLHGDGGLALFNGATSTCAADIASIIAIDATRGRPLAQARYSGYQRLVHGGVTLIADTGPPPPAGQAAGAHAGCLSFELSHDRHRIIVNCGEAAPEEHDWIAVARTTAAHSTATVNDCPSGRLRSGWLTRRLFAGALLDGPRTVEVEREDGPAGTIVEAGHDGYERRFGLIHSRRLYLSEDGCDLRGEDSFMRSHDRFRLGGGHAERYALRFHLHPSVRATASKSGDSVLLLLPNHVGWRFTAVGGAIGLEESVYLGDGGQPRRTRQIVVHGAVADRAVVKWALKKGSKRHGSAARDTDAPGLPLGDDVCP
jgi:uncharacterized heparinase superfamily protein